ncbi:protein neprosin-like [Silene latifolia]|uniref:protein neprosin-like n=1 Tax=Silene latifolia TaxID=37657 RepID=UPI003D779891
MSKNADVIGWGGEVVDTADYKTPTQMGNGRTSTGASYVKQIKFYVDDDETPVITPAADDLDILETQGNCYSVSENDGDELVVFYGGPGLVVAILFSSALLGDGRQFGGLKTILKTIKTEDGEVIDCVNILKQPAFSHPLLLNHTIQLEPSFNAITNCFRSRGDLLIQSWHKYGQCPDGSIPIVRKLMQGNNNRPIFPKQFPPFSSADMLQNNNDANYQHQWALVSADRDGQIQGGHAKINNWRPFVNQEGGSMSQIWIAASSGDNDRETIEVGWMVAPSTGSSDSKIFIYWTNDNYQSTGCYNLDCPGFVQTSNTLAIGAKLANISTYGGAQFDIEYDVRKDPKSKNWWLTINGQTQGYWPAKLFKKMSKNADVIAWGGEVVDSVDYKNPTHMGNGRTTEENPSYVKQLKFYVDDEDAPEVTPAADDLSILETQGNCYAVSENDGDELVVFYGGPGCPE